MRTVPNNDPRIAAFITEANAAVVKITGIRLVAVGPRLTFIDETPPMPKRKRARRKSILTEGREASSGTKPMPAEPKPQLDRVPSQRKRTKGDQARIKIGRKHPAVVEAPGQ